MSELNQVGDLSQNFKSERNDVSDLENLLFAKGRFSRLSYIAWFTLWGLISQITEYGINYLLEIISYPEPNSGAIYTGILMFTVYLVSIVIYIYVFIMISVRRCHDINLGGINTGWFILPFVNIVFWIYLMFKPGTEDSNKYGYSRRTLPWEKVLGYIGAVVVCIMLIAVTASIILSLMGLDSRESIN